MPYNTFTVFNLYLLLLLDLFNRHINKLDIILCKPILLVMPYNNKRYIKINYISKKC